MNPVKEENMITMKEFMNQLVERENRGGARTNGSTNNQNKKKRSNPNNSIFNEDFADKKRSQNDNSKINSNKSKTRYSSTKPSYNNNNDNSDNDFYSDYDDYGFDDEDGYEDARFSINQDEQKFTGNQKRNSSDKISKNSMMRNNMSIEELEAVMMKRWGTNSDRFTADPREYEEGYDNDDNYSDGNTNSDGGIFFRGKAVRDPWEEDSKDNGRQTKQSKYNQEFYDEDDEGYEGESSMRSKQRG